MTTDAVNELRAYATSMRLRALALVLEAEAVLSSLEPLPELEEPVPKPVEPEPPVVVPPIVTPPVVVPPVVTPPPPAAKPYPWLGMCVGTGFNTEPVFVDSCVRAVNQLGIKRVRMGMDGVGGKTAAAAFTWAKRDAVVAKWRAAGILLNVVVSYREHIAGKDRTAWRRFVTETMRKYAGFATPVWIIDNETDRAKEPASSPAEAVEFTRIACEVRDSLGLKGVVRIESPPVSAADAGPVNTYLKGMLDFGLAKHCDIIGIHAYGGQFDDGRIGTVRKLLTSKGIKLPIGISEAGVITAWAPTGTADVQKWRADQYRYEVRQAAKHGFEYLLLFDLDRWKQREVDWRLATFSADGSSFVPIEPVWSAVKEMAASHGAVKA